MFRHHEERPGLKEIVSQYILNENIEKYQLLALYPGEGCVGLMRNLTPLILPVAPTPMPIRIADLVAPPHGQHKQY